MARKAPIEDSLLQFTKCSVCLEEVENMKVFPCQHNICLQCVKQLTAKKNRLKCPSCNAEHSVPNGGCEYLPDNLMVKQIAHLIKEKAIDDSETIDANYLPPKKKVKRSVPPEPEETADGNASEVEACGTRGTEAQDPDTAIRDKRTNDIKGMALSKELEKAVEDGEKCYMKAQQWVTEVKAKKEKITADAQALSEAIEEYRQSVEFKSQKKKQDTDASKSIQIAEIDESIGSVEPNADKIKASIDSAPGLIARLANGSCKPEDITSAQQLLDEIRGLETNLDLPSVVQDNEEEQMEGGDSVCLNYDKDVPVDQLLNDEVSMASVGILVGLQVSIADLEEARPCVIFPEKYDWKGRSPNSIKKSSSKSKLTAPGDRVRIKSSVKEPHFSWKGVRPGESRGIFKKVDLQADAPDDDVGVIIDFPEERGWKGLYSEIERAPGCGFEVGDDVKIKSDIDEPQRGWAGVTKTSIGKITKVEGTVGKEEITINFPECNNWIGLPTELEMPRKLKIGDKVKVKASVKTPEQGWRRVSHKDVGVLKKLPENSASDQRAQVKFPGRNELWSCRLEELELEAKDNTDRLREALRELGGSLAGALLMQPGMGLLGLDEDEMTDFAGH